MKVPKFRYSSEEVAAAADVSIVNAYVTILFNLGCVCVWGGLLLFSCLVNQKVYRKEVSGVLQGSVLGPFLFLAYVNDIWRNMESTIRLFADDCVIYRKIMNNADMEKLQKDLDRLGEWAVENAMKLNPSKSKAFRFTRARVKDPLNY